MARDLTIHDVSCDGPETAELILQLLNIVLRDHDYYAVVMVTFSYAWIPFINSHTPLTKSS